MSTEAVILAGGYSSRAGGFKMEFDIDGKSILQRCIEGFYETCSRIIVVTGYRHEKIDRLVEGYEKVMTVYNENYPKGMFTSIKKGISFVESDRFFLTPGDYPMISRKIVEEILERSSENDYTDSEVIIPSFQYKGGHPILMKSSLIQEIISKSDDYNLRDFLKSKNRSYITIDDYGILTDVDTQDDYRNAVKLMF